MTDKEKRQLSFTKHSSICAIALSFANLGITLWYWQMLQEKPDWPFISATLTIFEVFIAVGLIGGFWMLKLGAEEKAKEEAERVSIEVAKKNAREVAALEAKRVSVEWLRLLSGVSDGNDGDSFKDMINSLDNGQDGN